jgi:predicted ATP-grasp superfamily ATP-dependent carboligase
LKVLLLEYITGGGMHGGPLPPSLLQEGLLMRDALLRDLAALNAFDIYTTYDARLPRPGLGVHSTKIKESPLFYWQDLLHACDMALIIAPETNGVLQDLTKMLERTPAKNLGSDSTVVAAMTRKSSTYAALTQARIPTIATFLAMDFLHQNHQENFSHGYVVKPDDGAGCENTFFFKTVADFNHWLSRRNDLNKLVIQPYQPGIAASMSILCRQGQAWLLACNRQHIHLRSTEPQAFQFEYSGSEVNGLTQYWAEFTKLAQQLAQAIPGLNGYVGVDLLIDDDKLYVVDINPRITTSYIGLAASLNHNPAEFLVSATNDASFISPDHLQTNPVEVSVHG